MKHARFLISLRYGGDCISGKNSDRMTLNQIFDHATLTTPLHNPIMFHDHSLKLKRRSN